MPDVQQPRALTGRYIVYSYIPRELALGRIINDPPKPGNPVQRPFWMDIYFVPSSFLFRRQKHNPGIARPKSFRNRDGN